jgi:putative FmdB family regulatory protein
LGGLHDRPDRMIHMPIFEYRCKECDKEFETLVLGRERPLCPSCRSGKLEKLLSTFAAVTGSSRGSGSTGGPGPCGSCGDPRGPGACSTD